MKNNPLIALSIISLLTIILSGCHLEQGKLHFDELNLDPITVYQMTPLETTIYCMAEGDIPSGKKLQVFHEEALEKVEKNPEKENWGELVCLSLTESATIEQMRETVNALVLVMAVNKRQARPARGFKDLLLQKISFLERLKQEEEKLERAIAENNETITLYKEKIKEEKNKTSLEKTKVRNLESQVKKLKEVELLLQPK